MMNTRKRFRNAIALVLAAGLWQVADIVKAERFEIRVEPETGISVQVGDEVLVTDFMPRVRMARLETGSLEGGQMRYQFADAALDERRVIATSDGRGLELIYPWGTLRYEVIARENGIDLELTLENSGPATVADFEIDLLQVNLPGRAEGETRWVSNRDRPGIARVNWGEDAQAVALRAAIMQPEVLQVAFSGGDGPTRRRLAVRGGVRTFAPGAVEIKPLGQPRIEAGASRTFQLSLRLTPAAMPEHEAFADLYAAFRAWFPSVVDWNDRRPIGAIFLQTRGRISETNPRGWFNEPKIDITTEEGLADLERRFLQGARMAVDVLTGIGAQGMIVWNLEGEENPHPISYIGDPRLQAQLAPELNGFIDAYFQIFREAGLRTGVTLRPTQPYLHSDGDWRHGTGSHMRERNPHNESFDALIPEGVPGWRFFPIVERLSRKIAFAQERWGATIFYVDTNGIYVPVGEDYKFEWMLLDHWVWRELRARHPDVLIIPEFARGPACFATVAPYDQLDHTRRTTTPAHVRRLYPESFVANYIPNTRRELLAKGEPWFDALVEAVTHGDTVIHRGWFNCGVNQDVRAIFAEASRRAPFVVYVGTDGITLNGKMLADPKELARALAAQIADDASVAERRVYVGYDPDLDRIDGLQPVLDAVLAADALVAWTQPMQRAALED